METTAGVSQGPVLRPVLWTILYDDVLKLDTPERVTTTGYADGLSLMVTAKDRTHIGNVTNKGAQIIKKGLDKAGLEMTTEKTKAVILEGYRKMTEPIIRIGDEEIHTIERANYIEVIFGRSCSFAGYIEAVTSRAERKTMPLKVTPRYRTPSDRTDRRREGKKS